MYSGAAVVAQTLATAADFWLMRTTAEHAEHPLTSEQVKETNSYTPLHHENAQLCAARLYEKGEFAIMPRFEFRFDNLLIFLLRDYA